MGDNQTGQVSTGAAKIYEEFYLPALFEEWPARVIGATQIQAGDRVLDVACGTGVLAISIAAFIGSNDSVVGIDINDGMLSIAKSKAPEIEWRNAPAESLPFEEASFNCALSQFGLMYFSNQEMALREMMRVLLPGGQLAIVVWDMLENNPGLAAEEQLWQQTFGEEEADDTPYSLGDKKVLLKLFEDSGLSDVEINTCQGSARFLSINDWIYTGAKGWTADDALSDEQLEFLLVKARQDLTGFTISDGSVAFPTSAHIVTATKQSTD